MLDKKIFLREMAVLAELYARPALSEVLVSRYYEYLASRLSTAEFEAAARTIFETEQFWPPPVRFIHAAKGDPRQLAQQEWDLLLEEARHGRLAELTDAGKVALKTLGGYRAVAYANESSLPALRRAFLDTYTNRETPGAQLQLEAPEISAA